MTLKTRQLHRNFKEGIAKIWRSLKTNHGVISFDFEVIFWTRDTLFDFSKIKNNWTIRVVVY